jgi:hypothetical protein
VTPSLATRCFEPEVFDRSPSLGLHIYAPCGDASTSAATSS